MEVTYDVLYAGATLFDVDRATLRHLGGMDGAVYEYQSGCAGATDSGARILKFTPIAAERLPTVRAKFDFVNYLGARGIGVAKPILSIHGELVEPLDAGEVFYAVTSAEKAPGQLAKNSREWGPALFEKWGQVIGQMHRLTKDYDNFRTWPDGLIARWEDEHQSFARWCDDDGVRAKWLALSEQLATLPQDKDCFGLIHNDLHQYNFFVSRTADGELRLTLFDFDVCNYHFFMTDIGIAVFHALWEGRPQDQSAEAFATRFLEHFMRGYCREHSLEDAWLKRLPMFLKYRQMLLHTVFSHEWQNPNQWQARHLNEWRRCIVNDVPVVNLA